MEKHQRAISSNPSGEFFTMGTIKAEKPDSDYSNREFI